MPELRQYQKEGVERLFSALQNQRGALLADEPGVGKTPTAIELSNCLMPRSILVVCPAVARINWQREFETWSELCVPVIASTKKSFLSSPLPPYVITNYDILHKLPNLVRSWDLIIFDEAHRLKNRSSIRSKAARILSDRARHTVMLTGTPIENRPVELWNLMVILGWLQPASYMEYVKTHCGYRRREIYVKGKRREIVDVSGAERLPQLREFLANKGMVRRRKEDVMPELPPKTYRIYELPRRRQWRSELLRSALGDAAPPKVKSQLAYFRSLAQIAQKTGDRKSLVESIAEARRLDGEDKVDQVVEYIEECLESEAKIGLFCYHRAVHAALMQKLAEYGAVGICGDTPPGERQRAVDAFQTTGGPARVFVGQLKAAGEAITLTAASHVVFAELDWVPGLMEQAADRFHRMGQKDAVLVDYMVFEDSTDSLVAKRLIEKQKVLGQLFGKEDDCPINPVDIFI